MMPAGGATAGGQTKSAGALRVLVRNYSRKNCWIGYLARRYRRRSSVTWAVAESIVHSIQNAMLVRASCELKISGSAIRFLEEIRKVLSVGCEPPVLPS